MAINIEGTTSLKDLIYRRQGYLDEILTIFEIHKHPFVLIDNLAMRWMGCRNLAGLDVDILVRRSQLSNIVTDLLSTGNWRVERLEEKEKEKEKEKMSYHRYTDGETVLCAAESYRSLYRFLRLWTEDLYFLSVDGPKIEIPDISAWKTTIVEQRYHPEMGKRKYGPRNIGVHEPGILPPLEYEARSPEVKVSIFIPTIARYLEARLQQDRRSGSLQSRRGITSDCDIHNFFRYMFFDLPHQQKKILPELSKDGQEHFIYKMHRYKRKFNYKIDGSTMKFIKIVPWESEQQDVQSAPSQSET